MTRDDQFTALISHLQGIDAMCAAILLREPMVANVPPEHIVCADGFTWQINGSNHVIHAATFSRALLASGMIYLRVLSIVLDIQATRGQKGKPIELVELQRRETVSTPNGLDIKWYDLPSARGLSLALIESFGKEGISVETSDRGVVDFPTVYLKVLKAVDKLVAHLTHEDIWADVKYGEVISAACFIVVASQQLLLRGSWQDTFDNLVYTNSSRMLPKELWARYMETINEYHKVFTTVMHLSRTS